MRFKLPVDLTDGQVKKHVKQMNADEIVFLANKIYNIEKYRKSKHLSNRIDTKDIPFSVYKAIIKDGVARKIVEYNETPVEGSSIISRRVLIRNDKLIKTKFYKGKVQEAYGLCNLCFVIDIDTGTIITAYFNLACDNHTNIDWSRYDSDICILKEKESIFE